MKRKLQWIEWTVSGQFVHLFQRCNVIGWYTVQRISLLSMGLGGRHLHDLCVAGGMQWTADLISILHISVSAHDTILHSLLALHVLPLRHGCGAGVTVRRPSVGHT